MEEFLIGAGLALLIALLAWSDQIRSMQRDTIEAEKYLDEKRKISWKTIKKLYKKKAAPEEILNALNEMLTKQSVENIDDINVITQFRTLYNRSKKLERQYNIKYILVIIMTFLFLLSGIVMFLSDATTVICLLGFITKLNVFLVVICISFALCTLTYTIYLNYSLFEIIE